MLFLACLLCVPPSTQVIGLTIMAYRYEGLRMTDLRRLITQLKADFSRQGGPRDSRPASILFQSWLVQVAAAGGGIKDADDDDDEPSASAMKTGTGVEESKGGEQQMDEKKHGRVGLPVSPLPLFQPGDVKQLGRLHSLVKLLPDVLHYYLRQHVFPATMNFQSVKISAAGHELGSSVLFARRIGFSGTPTNLLPVDLGSCQYEPGSDGRVIHVLTNPEVGCCAFSLLAGAY